VVRLRLPGPVVLLGLRLLGLRLLLLLGLLLLRRLLTVTRGRAGHDRAFCWARQARSAVTRLPADKSVASGVRILRGFTAARSWGVPHAGCC
jgi:hypothetical protein